MLCAAGCADSALIPEFERDPEQQQPAVPDASEQAFYLEVAPQQLAFDASGNGLGGDFFVVRTNGAWHLELPEACNWIRFSTEEGRGVDTVRLHLFIDDAWHTAEVTVVAQHADGSERLALPVTVCQGTAPDASEDPETPGDPDDNTPDDPADPGEPKDPDHPEQPGDEDPQQPGDEDPNDDVSGGGGVADFSALSPDSRFCNVVGPTATGWRAENCAVYAGGGITDSDPNYPSLLGADAAARGLCMNGGTSAPGRIESPELTGGCGTLTFRYGTTRDGDDRVDFSVEIRQEGAVVRTFRITGPAQKFEAYAAEHAVHLPGSFRLVFRNNSPSHEANEVDCVTIFDIAWTGEPASEQQ